MEYLGKLFFYGIVIVLFIAVFLFWNLSRYDQERCDYIESLAKTSEVVSALDQWVTENVVDKDYYLVTGMHGRIAAHKNEDEEIYYIALPNNGVTGIEDEYSRFSIIKHDSEHNDPIVSTNVHSIFIGLGRDHIILTKNGHELSSHRGHDFKSGKLKKVGESIYAYCSNGKFRM